MSNSNFNKNGVDNNGIHWLQYAEFVVTAFAIYFGWAFFNDANFHHFSIKIFKFWNCNGYNPLGYRVRSLKRVRIMNIKLDVPTGKYRELSKEELLELNRLLENSSKTYE